MGENWENAQLSAKTSEPGVLRASSQRDPGDLLATHTAQSEPSATEAAGNPSRLVGYAGHLPKIYARNIFGKTFEAAQQNAKVV